jgi:hypothetical protein
LKLTVNFNVKRPAPPLSPDPGSAPGAAIWIFGVRFGGTFLSRAAYFYNGIHQLHIICHITGMTGVIKGLQYLSISGRRLEHDHISTISTSTE